MGLTFSGGQRYRYAENVAWRKVEQDVVLLNLDTSDYFSITSVGVFIWERLGEGASPNEIVPSICEEFVVEPAEARKHLEAFIRDLCNKNLLIPR
jgi:hypothetical protein